ncbi:ATP-binding protein [Streptomonospora alba]|uniref:ATP-binding protein n=1 Tax=Streptomonospora alba TaxID=183763 RepID=UPI000699A493|nr:ATP-binding protein [Streptomonospora alba]
MPPEQPCWLPGTPEVAGIARPRVTATLGPSHPLLFEAQLIVSELVTNAYRHTRSGLPDGRIGLTVAPLVCGCLLEVADGGPRPVTPTVPRLRTPSGEETEGRGLLLIESTAHAWGTTDHAEGGRSVWALLVYDAGPPDATAARDEVSPAHRSPGAQHPGVALQPTGAHPGPQEADDLEALDQITADVPGRWSP